MRDPPGWSPQEDTSYTCGETGRRVVGSEASRGERQTKPGEDHAATCKTRGRHGRRPCAGRPCGCVLDKGQPTRGGPGWGVGVQEGRLPNGSAPETPPAVCLPHHTFFLFCADLGTTAATGRGARRQTHPPSPLNAQQNPMRPAQPPLTARVARGLAPTYTSPLASRHTQAHTWLLMTIQASSGTQCCATSFMV